MTGIMRRVQAGIANSHHPVWKIMHSALKLTSRPPAIFDSSGGKRFLLPVESIALRLRVNCVHPVQNAQCNTIMTRDSGTLPDRRSGGCHEISSAGVSFTSETSRIPRGLPLPAIRSYNCRGRLRLDAPDGGRRQSTHRRLPTLMVKPV